MVQASSGVSHPPLRSPALTDVESAIYCLMKRFSSRLSLLSAAAGLFSCLALPAQQYHDAAAFGLKGHVKECRVFNTGDGSETYDVHDFSYLAFTKEGKLDQWIPTPIDKTNRVRHITGTDRSDGRLNGIVFSDEEEYRFRYKGDDLIGFYDKYSLRASRTRSSSSELPGHENPLKSARAVHPCTHGMRNIFQAPSLKQKTLTLP